MQNNARFQDTFPRQELEEQDQRQDTPRPIEYPRVEELGDEVQDTDAGYFIGQPGQRNTTPVPVPRPDEGSAWTDTLEHPDPDESVDTRGLDQLPQDVTSSGYSWDSESDQRTTTASRSEAWSSVDLDPGNAGPSSSRRPHHPPRTTLDYPGPDESVDTQGLDQLPQDVTSSGYSWDAESGQPSTTASRSEAWSLIEDNTGDPGPSSGQRARRPPRRPRDQRGTYTCDDPACTTSTATWPTPASLRQHQRSHIPYDERRYWCDVCPNNPRFLYRKDLERHRRRRNHMAPNVRCSRCGRLFAREDLRRRHQRSQHGGADEDRVP